jgi:hypothetical protein
MLTRLIQGTDEIYDNFLGILHFGRIIGAAVYITKYRKRIRHIFT